MATPEHVKDGYCSHCGSRTDEEGFSVAEDGGVEEEQVTPMEEPESDQHESTVELRKAALMDKISRGS